MKTYVNLIKVWLMASAISMVGCSDHTSHIDTLSMSLSNSTFDFEKEKVEILSIIDNESKAFWDKDYDKWASYWAHEPFIRTMGWWELGGVTVVKGWDQRGPRTKSHMEQNPDPNPQNVERENINVRISENMAWVTFDQYGKDTGEPEMDMPGLSRETRIFEKLNGQWKIVYVGWLLEGKSQEAQEQ